MADSGLVCFQVYSSKYVRSFFAQQRLLPDLLVGNSLTVSGVEHQASFTLVTYSSHFCDNWSIDIAV